MIKQWKVTAAILSMLAFSSCIATSVNPPTGALPERPFEARRTISIRGEIGKGSFRGEFFGAELSTEELGPIEDLSPYLKALDDSGQVRICNEGGELQCDFVIGRFAPRPSLITILSTITFGVIPGRLSNYSWMQVQVQAPGRTLKNYEFRCERTMRYWLPLAPIFFVQLALDDSGALNRPNSPYHLVHALLNQLDKDGWLDVEGETDAL